MRLVLLVAVLVVGCVPPAYAGDPPLSPRKQALVAEAEALETEAKALFRENKPREAEKKALAALDKRRRALGRQHPSMATGYRVLGAVTVDGAIAVGTWHSLAPAIWIYERALELLAQMPTKDVHATAECHFALGRIFSRLGDARRAAANLSDAYLLYSAVLAPDDPVLFDLLYLAIEWVPEEAQQSKVTAQAEQQRSGVVARVGEDNPAVAVIHRLVGLAHLDHDRARATSALDKALAIRARHFDADAMIVAESHLDRARLAWAWGNLASHDTHRQAAAAIWKAAPGDVTRWSSYASSRDATLDSSCVARTDRKTR